MKRSWLCGVAILSLLSSCMLAPRMSAQSASGQPQKIHVCFGNSPCEDAVWVGDHYEGHQGATVSNRYWIKEWGTSQVELYVKSAIAGDVSTRSRER